MNDHEIIKLAIEAGLAKPMDGNQYRINQFAELKKYTDLVVQLERNECAVVCEIAPEPDGKDLAERIRARSNK